MVGVPMSARDEILSRIRSANEPGTNRAADYAALPRPYNQAIPASRAEMVELFAERLHDYNATVHRCTSEAIGETIAKALETRGKTGLLVPTGIPKEWLPDGLVFTEDHGLTYAQLDTSEGVLTGCAAAIALTGTIVLHHLPQNGRRALTLIPDYHLCVVYTDQIVASVPEGIRKMAALQPPLLTTVSGPSATSDIEMIRVKGVHGPRTLEVILAER